MGRAKLSLAPYLKVLGGHAPGNFKMGGLLPVGCCVLGERAMGYLCCAEKTQSILCTAVVHTIRSLSHNGSRLTYMSKSIFFIISRHIYV